MTLKRGTKTAERTEVICHWCREPGNGGSPYRTFTDELPAGVRVIACGPDCKDVPEGLEVFPAWAGPFSKSGTKTKRKDRT